MIISFLLIYNFTFNIENCKSQWVQTNGPNRGFIFCFASSETNVFAGSHGNGVFCSTNNGENWHTVNNGLTYSDINSLMLKDSNLFAGTKYGGIFRSSNNGGNWFVVNNGLTSLSVNTLFAKDQYIFTGTTSGIFLSTNNGTNWVGCGLINRDVKSIILSGSSIFAGTNGNGVFFSTNFGGTWTAVYNGLTNQYVISLAVIDSYLFAGTANNGGVFISSNNGANWTPSGLILRQETRLTIKGNNLFAGTWNGGVYTSTNYGINWTSVNNGLTNYSIHTISTNGINLFVGTEYGIYISTNDGVNWTVNNDGITNELICTLASSGPYIFAGSEGNGIFKSSNYGLNWEPCGLDGKGVFAIATSCNNIFAGTVLSGGMFLSTNYGNNWTAINNGLTTQIIYSMVVKGNNIFAGTEAGVFLSTNNGGNWNLVTNGIANNIFALAASRTDVFAGSNYLFRSSNNGQNWINISNGLTNSNIRSILASGNTVYAGTYGGVFISTNNGDNWSSIGLTNLTIYTLFNYCENIIAGTSNGIYLYNSISKTWSDKNQGFCPIPSVTCFLNINNDLFAGTFFQSVWRRSLYSFVEINNNSEIIPTTITLYQNYPNPFNPMTKIKFSIIENGKMENSIVTLKVYNILGTEITTLVNEKLQPGTYEVPFSINQFPNNQLPSGVYFYKLVASDFVCVKRMVLIK